LDFGCGSDRFLNYARTRGWNTIGVDFSPNAILQVQKSGHQGHLISPHVWDEIDDESIDLVRMNHVLEHLYHPADVLRSLQRKMRKGGQLHIATPNNRSITFRIFRSYWFGADPRHVVLFSSKSLTLWIERLGFTQVQAFDEILTKDFLRTVMGFVGARVGWVNDDPDAIMRHSVLNELCYLPAKLAAARRRADRFHLFARRAR
jgi:SAM-dependent methyltransferase